MAEAMEGVAEATAEVEVRDIPFYLETITSKLGEIEAEAAEVATKLRNIKANTTCIRQGMEQIQNLNEEQESLNSRQELEDLADTSFNEEKLSLSPTAKRLIEILEPTPLDPQRFTELLEKCHGRPKPAVLPIVRGYSNNIHGIMQQLRDFKKSLKEAHKEYMYNRKKKDENLEKRIKLLVGNIENELKKEEIDGKRQASMDQFVVRQQ